MASSYTVPENRVIYSVDATLGNVGIPDTVHLTQYDKTIPILAVRLLEGPSEWAVPDGATASVRMEKPDGKHVYDPALGFSEDRKTVYIAVTAQMTSAAGKSFAIVEITDNESGVIGSGRIVVMISRNPVPADAYESTDEYKSLKDILDMAQDAKNVLEQNKDILDFVSKNKETIESVPENAQAASEAADAASKSALAASASASSAKTSADAAAADSKVVKDNLSDIQAIGENIESIKSASDNATRAEAAAETAETEASRAEAAAKNAQSIAQGQKGYYATADALRAAVPEGADGDWAIVGETDTIWVWDSDTSSWSDSGNKTDLSQYYTKTQTDAELNKLQTALGQQIGTKQDKLTLPLPVAQGGTGATDAASARTNLDINVTNLGAVPTTRKVNNKALSTDISLTAADVGALGATAKANTAGTADKVAQSLSFTGAETKTYNGSTAVTVDIPKARTWNVLLDIAKWSKSENGDFFQSVLVDGMTESVVISPAIGYTSSIPAFSGEYSLSERKELAEALGCINQIESLAGRVVFYCYEKEPTISLTVRIQEVLL